MFIRPKEGLRIRDPELRDFLPPEGREVPDNDYWRRLRDLFQDVEEVDPPAAEAAPDAPQETEA